MSPKQRVRPLKNGQGGVRFRHLHKNNKNTTH